MLDKREFYINGAWTPPAKARDFDVINPATEETCAVISLGDQADTDAAVAAAKAAFEGWATTPQEQRVAAVQALYQEYKRRAGDMAAAISMEMGAPIDLASTAQVGSGIGHIKGFLNAMQDWQAEMVLSSILWSDTRIRASLDLLFHSR